MPRKRSKKKSTNYNQYLPIAIIGALVIAFIFLGAGPTGKFTDAGEYSFVTESGEPLGARAVSPDAEFPSGVEAQDVYVLFAEQKIIKLEQVPSYLTLGELKSQIRIEHSDNAVAVDLSRLEHIELTFTMYLPNLGSGVFICSEAKSLYQINNECQNIQNIEHDQLTASAEQYIIEGLIGTGGQSNPPPETYYQDSDGDGYGNPSVSQTSSTPPQGYVLDNTDCDDSNSNSYQYLTGYSDSDSDNYGAGSSQQVCSGSSLPAGYVSSLSNGEDCNDNDVSVWQLTSSYTDNDGDGYGTGSTQQQVCTSTPVQDNTDCNDNDANAYEEYCRDWDNDGYCTLESTPGITGTNDVSNYNTNFQISCTSNQQYWTRLADAEYDSNGDLYVDCNPWSEYWGYTVSDGWIPRMYNVSPYFPNNVDSSGIAQTACGSTTSGFYPTNNYSQGLNCPCWWN